MNFNPALIAPELFQFLLILVLFLVSVLNGTKAANTGKWVPLLALVGIIAAVASFSRGPDVL